MTFSGRFLFNIILFAADHGADEASLYQVAGHDAAELCDEEFRVEADAYNAVLEAAQEQTSNPLLGLHLGENLNLSAAGLIAQITQTSRTIKEGLEYCCEFANLGCRALPLTLIEKSDHYRVTMTPDPEWKLKSEVAVQQTIDGTMAFSVREFQSLTQRKHFPIAVHLTRPRPAEAEEYERVLGCRVLFGQYENALLLKKEHVLAPVTTSNYDLLRILVAHAHEKIEKIQQESGTVSLVRKTILNLAAPDYPTIETVAANLNQSVRSLQRKLSEEGESFKGILESVRKDLAEDYLKRSDLSVKEVAYLLNYADASVFNRSFKRWTGQTPQAWRSAGQA